MELMPGYKMTEAGVIPADWESRPLSSIGRFKNGINKGSEAFGHGSPFVNLMDVFGVNSIKSCDGLGLVKTSDTEQDTYDLKLGDVIFIRSSVKPSGVGLTAVVEGDLPKTVYSGFLIRFRDGNALDIAFKKHCFYSEKFRSNLIAASTVSANTNINQDNLKKLFIALPPTTAEQRTIAQALSDVDALLAKLDQMIAKKRDLKQATMQQLLTGKTQLPGFTGAWETKQLKDLAYLSKTGINPSSTPEPLFTHFSLLAFDVNETPVIESGASIGSNKFVVPPSAVLLSKLNPRIPRVWAPNCIPSNSVCSTEFLVLIPNEGVDRDFFKYLCTSSTVASQMELHAIGTTGSHQRIHPTQVLAIEVETPTDDDERLAISSVLRDIDAELSTLSRRRNKTVELKQAMMQELLTGKTRLL